MTLNQKPEQFQMRVVEMKRYALLLVAGFLLTTIASAKVAAVIAWLALPVALMCLAMAVECFSIERQWTSQWKTLTDAQRRITNLPALRANGVNAGGAAVVLFLIFALGA